MNIWNYIGEFFLFRWLYDKFRKSATEHDTHSESIGTLIDKDGEYPYDSLNDGMPHDDAVTDVSDNVIDESNDSEDLDDLDKFMRNNGNTHYSDYGDDYLYSDHDDWDDDWNDDWDDDWDDDSHDEFLDDFLDEQDDYDMMDDDF